MTTTLPVGEWVQRQLERSRRAFDDFVRMVELHEAGPSAAKSLEARRLQQRYTKYRSYRSPDAATAAPPSISGGIRGMGGLSGDAGAAAAPAPPGRGPGWGFRELGVFPSELAPGVYRAAGKMADFAAAELGLGFISTVWYTDQARDAEGGYAHPRAPSRIYLRASPDLDAGGAAWLAAHEARHLYQYRVGGPAAGPEAEADADAYADDALRRWGGPGSAQGPLGLPAAGGGGEAGGWGGPRVTVRSWPYRSEED